MDFSQHSHVHLVYHLIHPSESHDDDSCFFSHETRQDASPSKSEPEINLFIAVKNQGFQLIDSHSNH